MIPGLEDRVVGCVLGLALGDKLGVATALARNLVRSLAERGGFDADDLVARHLERFRSGAVEIGSLTGRVLSLVDLGEGATDAAREVWEERGPEVSAGNGSVVYCAPLGIAYANRPRRLVEVAPELSAVTHYDERCRTAVVAVSATVASLVRAEEAEAAVHAALDIAADRPGGEELEFLVEVAGRSRPVDGPDQGFCLYAAAVGLQAGLQGDSFESELIRVVSLGGDTHANAAVAGALLGARFGREELPGRWLERLQDREAIEEEARRLVPVARKGT